jgi:hypothetical protein
MKTLHIPMSLLLLLFVTACVTINVYFPAEAAVKAADRIILDVYGKVPEQQQKPAESAEPTSWLVPSSLPGRALTIALPTCRLIPRQSGSLPPEWRRVSGSWRRTMHPVPLA